MIAKNTNNDENKRTWRIPSLPAGRHLTIKKQIIYT